MCGCILGSRDPVFVVFSLFRRVFPYFYLLMKFLSLISKKKRKIHIIFLWQKKIYNLLPKPYKVNIIFKAQFIIKWHTQNPKKYFPSKNYCTKVLLLKLYSYILILIKYLGSIWLKEWKKLEDRKWGRDKKSRRIEEI